MANIITNLPFPTAAESRTAAQAAIDRRRAATETTIAEFTSSVNIGKIATSTNAQISDTLADTLKTINSNIRLTTGNGGFITTVTVFPSDIVNVKAFLESKNYTVTVLTGNTVSRTFAFAGPKPDGTSGNLRINWV
jgi:hypothetical protein